MATPASDGPSGGPSGDAIARDFDGIARAIDVSDQAAPLPSYERALLALLQAHCGDVLDVGCGDGALTRRVAERAHRVLALDLSPEMIRLARTRAVAHANIEWRVADVATEPLPPASFDVVLSVATVHHLPLAPTIARLAALVRPGGWLVVQDLVRRPGVRHLPINAVAVLARVLASVARRGGRRSRVVDALYREHGRGEHYPTPAEAARAYAALLPGVRVVHHLHWRYTALWRRG